MDVARSMPLALGRVACGGFLWLLGLTAMARGQDGLAAPFAEGGGPAPSAMFAAPPTAVPVQVERPGFFAVARESIFDATKDDTWRPLSLRTFFTEGWDEAWVPEPDGSGDSQQGWINAADGNFYRLHFLSYTFTNRLGRADGHTGSYTLYTPLSRRLELITNVPFITSQPTLTVGRQTFPNPNPQPSPRPNPYATSAGFGDVTFTPRVMLLENDSFTMVAQTSIQTPSGYTRTGSGQSIVTPGVQFWWNFAESWVLRGGFSSAIGTNRQAGGTTLVSQMAIGKVLTPDNIPIFGDFTIYLSANVFNTVSASRTLASLTPGFRTHLGKGYYALGGVEIPVTGARPYEESASFWFMKTF